MPAQLAGIRKGLIAGLSFPMVRHHAGLPAFARNRVNQPFYTGKLSVKSGERRSHSPAIAPASAPISGDIPRTNARIGGR